MNAFCPSIRDKCGPIVYALTSFSLQTPQKAYSVHLQYLGDEHISSTALQDYKIPK